MRITKFRTITWFIGSGLAILSDLWRGNRVPGVRMKIQSYNMVSTFGDATTSTRLHV
jgi:hypothetical protein